MKLGLLGGTFNPIHLAHLRIAEEAREAVGLDQVLFIPAADPPHKPLAGDVAFELRAAMVLQAIADNPSFGFSDLEARRGGKSYTVDTLTALRIERPDDQLYFIIGSDSFLELRLWHRYADIFGLSSLIVVERPEKAITEPLQQLPVTVHDQFVQETGNLLRHNSGTSVRFVIGTRLDISSSQLRERIAQQQSIRYLVPSAIETFITQKGLYQP
ncbi:MAG: nicotinate-nucleotide adenylyltransferase [Geobacter sp.]|nr:nicotinate-nucleotide adenylyltransferase [Geobacter sp.]